MANIKTIYGNPVYDESAHTLVDELDTKITESGIIGLKDKMDEIREPNYHANLCDNTKLESGYIGYQSGTVLSHETYRHTDYIPVISGVVYICQNLMNVHFSFYDSSKEYYANTTNDITTFSGGIVRAFSNNTSSVYFTAPVTGYVRMTTNQTANIIFVAVRSSDEDTEDVDVTDTEVKPQYRPYGYREFSTDISELKEETGDFLLGNLDIITGMVANGLLSRDYTGGTWQFVTGDSVTLSAGNYICVVYDVAVSNIGYFALRADSTAGTKIIDNQYSYTQVQFTLTSETLCVPMMQVSTATESEAGTYHVRYAIYDASSTIIPSIFTGADITKNEVVSYLNDKLDSVIIGKNLFNKNASGNKVGYYLNTSGDEAENTSGLYGISDYINVTSDAEYTYVSRAGGSCNWFYDADKNRIKSTYVQNTTHPVTFTVPSDAIYIRVSYGTAEINATQLELGSERTYYEEYKTIDCADVIRNIDNNADTEPERYLRVTGDLSAGNTLVTEVNHVKNGKHLIFDAKVTTMGEFRICHGYHDYGATFLDIDATNIKVISYAREETVRATWTHGLTISDDIQVYIDVDTDTSCTAKIRICSNGTWYENSIAGWEGCNGTIYAESVSAEFTACTLSWSCDGYWKDIQLYGDSYFGITNTLRWMHYLVDDGYGKNHLIDGYAGRNGSNALIAFKNNIKHSMPKYAVWCMGMNDNDSSTAINSSYKSSTDDFLALCDSYGIIPILATIPSAVGGTVSDTSITTMRINKYKNAYVRSSGRRYIDFDTAVGASEDDGTWYDGMLSSDGVHPTEKGARALYLRALADVPELMMKTDDADVVSALGYTPAKATDLTAHTSDGTIHITSTERTNWNAAKDEADELKDDLTNVGNSILLYPFKCDFNAVLARPNYPAQTVYSNTLNGIRELYIKSVEDEKYYVSKIYAYGSGKSEIELCDKDGKYYAVGAKISRTEKPTETETVTLYRGSTEVGYAVIDWSRINIATGTGLDYDNFAVQEICIDRTHGRVQDEELTRSGILLYPFKCDFNTVLTRPDYPTQTVYSNTLNGIKELCINSVGFEKYYLQTLYRYGNNRSVIRFSDEDGEYFVGNTTARSEAPSDTEKVILYRDSVEAGYAVIDWTKINTASGLNLDFDSFEVQEICIDRRNAIKGSGYCSFVGVTDYYVTDSQQRIYLNELAYYDKNGYFEVNVTGATYPEVTTGYNGECDYIEFNCTSTKDFTVKIKYYYNGESVDSLTVTVHAVVGFTLPTAKYMFIGDSLTYANVYEKQFKDMNGENVVLYGTRGSGDYLHEGRYGWSTKDYINSASKGEIANPFYNATTSTFDFSYYMTQYTDFNDVDIVVLFLGRNDGYSSTTITNLNKMISSVLAYNSNIKVYVVGAYNVACNSSGTGLSLQSAGVFNRAAHYYNKELFYPAYTSGETAKIIPLSLNLDNKYDYATAEKAVSDIDSRTMTVYTNNVHPSDIGYKKFGIMLNGFFHYELNK